MKPSNMADAHVVGSSNEHMLSLMAINRPSMGDFGSPDGI